MEKQKETNPIVGYNADFLFIYDATLTNPNGDPDRENKPRMDEETKTNLVTDTRLKRYIRDYMKLNGLDIFVDKEGHDKVSVDTRLLNIIYTFLDDKKFNSLEKEHELKVKWELLKNAPDKKEGKKTKSDEKESKILIEQVEADSSNTELYKIAEKIFSCLLYTSPSPRDATLSRMPSSA